MLESMRRSPRSTGTNDRALRAKHQPMPTVAMRAPAMAGPTMRADVIERRVQGDGVDDLVGRHQVVDQGPAGRVVEGVGQAEHGGEDVDRADGDPVRDDERGQHRGRDAPSPCW